MDILTPLVVFLIGITTIVTVESRARRLDKRVRGLEYKIDALLKHWELEVELPELADVVALARAGDDVAAVKKFREATGAGLLEAKEAVDRITRDR